MISQINSVQYSADEVKRLYPQLFQGLGNLGEEYDAMPFSFHTARNVPLPLHTKVSTPELFQRRMNSMLSGLSGVLCLMDDILVLGKDEAEHDDRLEKVLKQIESTGVTLNPYKHKFSKSVLKFHGAHIKVCDEKMTCACFG